MDLDDILMQETLPPLNCEAKQAVPFPQANSLDCVLQTVLNTDKEGSILTSYIVTNVVNNKRQAAYYVNAAMYLGLCKRIGEVYYPTGLGLKIQRAKPAQRKMLLASIALSHPVISRWFTQIFLYTNSAERMKFISAGFKDPLSTVTKTRRSQCVLAWLAWIQNNLPRLKN